MVEEHQLCYNDSMNTRILDILEFDKVRDQFKGYLMTEQGKEALQNVKPQTNRQKIEQSFAELKEIMAIFQENNHLPLQSTQQIKEITRRLSLEGQLNLLELVALKKVLMVTQALIAFEEQLENISLKANHHYFGELAPLPSVMGSLQIVNDAGFLENHASDTLATIRRDIHKNEGAIRQILQDYLKKNAHLLTDTIISSRDGRSVLPVKATYRNRVDGIVHDISSSGNTIYIEPRPIVHLNEEIAQLKAAERHEIDRILQALSAIIRPYTHEIDHNAWIIGQLDLLQAKYQFAHHQKATIPTISSDQTIHLLTVRHPLIDNPVPNDLHFSSDTIEILITGPNTGGKTIMLKTLGLTQVMAQSGLPILADNESQIAIFNNIYADIGDEQSIEQSLSTFSGHMTTIIQILKESDNQSLILLDELGAGTDPQEGAALAMAILDYLKNHQIKTMATTHYPELKNYAIETPHVENASMAFDVETLSPTYRLMQGVPGRSNAFAISEQLGLPSEIISKAKAVSHGEANIDHIIERLEEQSTESRKRLDDIRDLEIENRKFNQAVKKLYREFSHEKDRELAKAQKEANQIIAKAISESDHILKNLQDKARLKPHEVIEAKTKLKSMTKEEDLLANNKVLKRAKKKNAVKVGDAILVTNYNQRGTLVKQLKNDKWEAQVGLIKMTLTRNEFTPIKPEPKSATKEKTVRTSGRKQTTRTSASARLDLRGKRYEAAMEELDRFIDQSLLHNLNQVDIIHGIGTGVIREGVTNYLSQNRHVKSFAYAPRNAGGSGVTIVQFK